MYGVRSTGLGNDVRAAEDEGCEEADHDRRGRRDDLAGRVLAPADGENRRGAEGNGTSWICGMFHVLGLNSAGAEQVVVTDSVASPEPRILMSAGDAGNGASPLPEGVSVGDLFLRPSQSRGCRSWGGPMRVSGYGSDAREHSSELVEG